MPAIFPDIVAPETIIVKGMLNTIDSDRQDLDFLTFLVGVLAAYFQCETFSDVVADYPFLTMPPDRLDIVFFLGSIGLGLACLSPYLLVIAKS